MKLNDETHAILGIIAIIALLVGVFAVTRPRDQHVTVNLATPPPKPGYVYSAVATTSAGPRLFGVGDVRALVHSRCDYEQNLINYHSCDDDLDWITGYGEQWPIRLPGGSYDRYSYDGAAYVEGSGWVLCFIALWNGGDFCLIHMTNPRVPVSSAPKFYPHNPSGTIKLGASYRDGDNQTAMVIGSVEFHPHPHSLKSTFYTGGTIVGTSSWPTSYIYGNGSCCQQDAHLCVLLDYNAEQWFLRVLSGADKPPKPRPAPFPAKQWCSWYVSHHKKCAPYKDRHGKLTWPASYFYADHHARTLGHKYPGDHWVAPSKKARRNYGFDVYPFINNNGHRINLDCWPHYRACRTSKA